MSTAKAAPISPLMTKLAAHIAAAPRKALPAPVVEKTKHHILDTIAAMVSGSRLEPGRAATSYARTLGGKKEALVIGTRIVTTAMNAALANGMLAHADETDDSHAPSLTHPGCGIVPAALAMGERERSAGRDVIRAVALGYDIGCRLTMTLNAYEFREDGHSTHSFGPMFGATVACAALNRFNPRQVRHALSYCAQQASGVSCWMRDPDHVEKAFDFGGMPARNAGLRQHIWVDPASRKIVKYIAHTKSGIPSDEFSFSDFTIIGDFILPNKIDLIFHDTGTSLSIKYDEINVKQRIDEQMFTVQPPAGAKLFTLKELPHGPLIQPQ